MAEQEDDPTTAAITDRDQNGERLDADKMPAELPERPIAAFEHGTTEREMREGESLDDRLSRELPDDDVAAQPPLEDTTSTPLMDDADETGSDREKDLVAELPLEEPQLDDSGQPTPPVSAEEAAVRVEDTDDLAGATDHRVIRRDDDLDRPTDEGA